MQKYDFLINIIHKLDYLITERELIKLSDVLKNMDLFNTKRNKEGFIVYEYNEQLEAFLDWYFSFIL
jgi:hypothetical protein